MNTPAIATASKVGAISALLCTFLSVFYVIAQLAEWAGLLGSSGGPHGSSTTLGIALLLTPSLLLALAFVALMVGVHHATDPARKIYSHMALSFAIIYATLVSIVYYVQLSFVLPRLNAGNTEGISLLLFTPFDSFLYAIDVYGYGLMSLSLLLATWSFPPIRSLLAIRLVCVANGMLIPFLVLQMYWPVLIWGGSLWAITFPLAMVLLAKHFRDLGQNRAILTASQ
ncbi:hypothetical protein [Permianibacter aggregans]|uniref:CcmB protein n=1 Tax=Permianibacter aggregans TaxID=1510150 RepID=A0A4R6UJJ2_9GAMM|nr:hypothetical protein [Permianibacter aggregans]QGX39778.1 hypothetical protein E2H98_08960 [Permianibacter aggregans]TDQ47098.1 CcmB protein [Permianibacter aggregans]